MRLVSAPTSVAWVRTSNSSGICGSQTVAKPASSAQRASLRSRSTLVPYRRLSGPIITPMRIPGVLPYLLLRTIFFKKCNVDLMDKLDRLFIGGTWSAPSTDEVLEVVSPHTEEPIAQAATAGATDVDRAVRAARAAVD